MNEPFAFALLLFFFSADPAWVQEYLIPMLGAPQERIITSDNLRPGAPRVSEIKRAVITSRYPVLILCQVYLADEWLNLSEQLGAHSKTEEQTVRLIPLLESECELPLRIDSGVRLDCTVPVNWEREPAHFCDLLNPPESQSECVACLYPGLIASHVEDARWFYGRAIQIDERVRRFRLQNFLSSSNPRGRSNRCSCLKYL